MNYKLLTVLACFTAVLFYLKSPTTQSPDIRELLKQPTHSNHPVRRLLAENDELQPLQTMSYGSWSAPAPPLSFFQGFYGQTSNFYLYNRSIPDNSSTPRINTILTLMLDPEYINERVAYVIIPVENSYNSSQSKWVGQTDTAQVITFHNFKQIQTRSNITLNFTISTTQIIFNWTDFNVTVSQHAFQPQVFAPWLLMTPSILMLLGMQFRGSIPQMKVSLICLLINLNFLIFVAFVMVYKGISNISNSESWIILTGVLTFICSIRLTQGFQNAIRRVVSVKGYIWFYSLSFFYLWLLFNFSFESWFQIVNAFILLPQIIHNTYYGIKPITGAPYYVVILSSQLYILYLRGIPHNIMRISPSHAVVIGIFVSIVAQLGFLFCQEKFGPRFFIPKRCIPNYYNYYVDIELAVSDRLPSPQRPMLNDQCPICLFQLTQQPDQLEAEKKEQGYKPPSKKIMKTPCNHSFHIQCLQKWLQHKFQCPVDRSPLPPIQ